VEREIIMRPLVVLLCAALLAPVLLNPAQAEQAVRKDAQKTARVKKTRQKVSAKALQDLLKPGLSQRELLAPYSAMSREGMGPARAGDSQGKTAFEDSWQANATSWKVDPSLDPKRLDQEALDGDSPLRLRLGRETVRDPLTHRELTPRADPLKAKQSMEELNLKGALENLGGKAEVQVDVLKF